MLAPVVLVFSVVIRNFAEADPTAGKRPPLIPAFILAFLALAAINSTGIIPEVVTSAISNLSRWALLIAIAAVGMKTSLRRIADVGGQAIQLGRSGDGMAVTPEPIGTHRVEDDEDHPMRRTLGAILPRAARAQNQAAESGQGRETEERADRAPESQPHANPRYSVHEGILAGP